MCGIVGGVFRDSLPRKDAATAFEAAAQTLAHRGPDDRGLTVIPGVNAILAFRRLSIIDLVSGQQPMSTEHGHHIIFNGEIYNYRDVRNELEATGLRFRTQSDTEVLLRGLAADGVAFLSKLHGMWGFAFLDEPGRRLVLARDRLGVKQLYYSCTEDGIFFASEPKALVALPWVNHDFNADELANYLTYRCVPSPQTLFRGINKLAAGTTLEHDLATWRSRVQRYWTMPADQAHTTLPAGESVRRAEQALLESVERRLVADVPVGALLSGGLDSSLVVAAMRRLGHSDIRTFSAVFPGSRDDERAFSRRVSARFGTAHHEQVTGSDDFLGALPTWIELNDDLVADASSLPLLLVSRLARARGCKVLLSGEGADELFAGYGSYHKYLLLRRAAGLLPFPRVRALVLRGLEAARLVGRPNVPRITEYFVRARDYLGTAALWGLEDLQALLPALAGYAPARATGQRLDALGTFDFARRIPDDLLVRTDRATMGSSVEARVPFLDHAFIDLVSRMPRRARAAPGLSKIALRRIARRWDVPWQTVVHRKIGFQIPLGHWFRTSLRQLWDAVRRERVVPGLSYPLVSDMITAHVRGEGDFEEMLWRIGALELWYRRWILGIPVDQLPGIGAGTPGARLPGPAPAVAGG